MKIYVNGEERGVTQTVTISELLENFGIKATAVVIERNGEVVSRDDITRTVLADGDRIEIVQFVGGGSMNDDDTTPPEVSPEPQVATEPEKPAKKVAKKKSTVKKKKAPKKTDKKSAKKSPALKGPKNLVIVESPAKAKTINKFLGNDFVVEASMGHVRDLPKSKMGVDLEKGDFEPHYIVIRKASKTVKHLKKVAKYAETIYLAPDPDREGEAISWHLEHIFRELNAETQIRRVAFNEITKDAILEAFQHPREIAMNLVDAQQARRILDRIVGYELSPLLWKKIGRGLSAGRVQSVALRVIVDREREIKKFVAQEYWSLVAKLLSSRAENADKPFTSKLEKIGEEKADLKNRAQTAEIRDEILKSTFKVEKVDKRERRRRPQAPFTTSKLQQEGYNRLRFPAAKTMRVAQKLYEGVELADKETTGLITYMRTDSVNIAPSAQQDAAEYIRGRFGDKFLPEKPPTYRSKKGAQEAHEAIRPTSIRRDPQSMKSFLADDEYKLYELIWGKFVASQMTPAIDELISISILAGDKYYFKTTGQRNLFPGFTVAYGTAKAEKSEKQNAEGEDTDDDDKDLPVLEVGEILELKELMGYQHFTKPPSRYNDASLVKTLEEDGIGRPSTYAPIIYTLLSREYVNRKGGALIPTDLGETVVDSLVEYFPNVVNVEFTAGMEEKLDKVEDGALKWIDVIREFYGPFQTLLVKAREDMKNIRREVIPTDRTCDLCEKPMVIRMGRFGRFMACSGFPECKYTRSIPTGFYCTEEGCGGELVKRRSKNRRTFYGCSKYPTCTYIVNKLPKKEGEEDMDDGQVSEPARETLGP
ncbi:MAG: type I DNA topoisomerase [Candidatus Omnitrophota bacterium]|nr:type I DNA topoisomerase [Candidatus Omnitrophota bacterium]